MQDDKRRLFPSPRLLALALVLGLAAGALAVYMKGGFEGNGSDDVAARLCEPALARAAALKPLATGNVAAFRVADKPVHVSLPPYAGPDGKPLTLAASDGKIRLVNLWATWCVPCREEMPALDRLNGALGGQDFEVVAINLDTQGPDKPKEFFAETGIKTLAHYQDTTMGAFNMMKTKGLAFGLPVTVLIDRKGCLLGALNGPAAWDAKDAEALIRAAF